MAKIPPPKAAAKGTPPSPAAAISAVAETCVAPAAGAVRKAFTIERVAGGWSFVTLTYEDEPAFGVIVTIERTEPDLKSITLEHFKKASFHYWTSIG